MSATSLAGKVAVITGGARGIGFACGKIFGARGAKVVLSDMDGDELDKAVASLSEHGVEAHGIVCDVSDGKSVDEMIKGCVDVFKTVDIMVANAGTCVAKDFLEMSVAEFEKVLKVNLTGTFITCQAAARQMVAQNETDPGRGGSIITMSSVNAEMAIPQIAGYNASKGGISNLTRCMSLALAPHSIRVNAVGPGSIKTRMLDTVMTNREAKERILSRTPIGRFGEPEEVAEACAFLASSASSYISGEIIYIDGARRAMNYTCAVDPAQLN